VFCFRYNLISCKVWKCLISNHIFEINFFHSIFFLFSYLGPYILFYFKKIAILLMGKFSKVKFLKCKHKSWWTVSLIENGDECFGSLFDSKLQWCNHVIKVINKVNRALNAIKLMKRFFTTLMQMLTSNYYSILYYNTEVWHLGKLKEKYKHLFLVVSARAIRVAYHYPDSN
jgi:hypothetical protein